MERNYQKELEIALRKLAVKEAENIALRAMMDDFLEAQDHEVKEDIEA